MCNAIQGEVGYEKLLQFKRRAIRIKKIFLYYAASTEHMENPA